MENAFNWDIKQTEILDINGNRINGYKQITRDSDGANIAVMKDSYTPMTTQEFSNTAKVVAEQIGGSGLIFRDWNTTAKNINIGSAKPVITCQMEMSEPLEIAGSKITGKLTLGVGFDGGTSFFVGHTNKYLRCSNEFASIVKGFTSRLTKNNLVRVEDIVNNIGIYRKYEEELYDNFKKFQNINIDEKLIKECVSRLVKLTDEEKVMTVTQRSEMLTTQKLNKIDDIMASVRSECAELGNNAWSLFNACTHYSTHVMSTKGSNEMSTMFGAKSEINKIGYDFCLELMS